MSSLPAVRTFGLVALGYLIAVSIAVAVTETVMLAPMAFTGASASGSIRAFLSDLPGMFVIGFFWTFLCALPGFVAVILFAERQRWSRWPAYAAAGFANVVPSLAIFWGLAGSPFDMPLMVVGAFAGGFAGGAAYWAGAGRFVARYRKVRPA